MLRKYRDFPELKEKLRDSLLQTYKEHPEILENRKVKGYCVDPDSYTSIEYLIANELDKRYIFYCHNFKIGRYTVDFLILGNVVVECDGEYWHRDDDTNPKARRREKFLHDQGFFTFHLKEEWINNSPEDCVNKIVNVMKFLRF